MPETEVDLASEVRGLYDLMRETDPGAYGGFVSDAAIRAVAKKHGKDWREVHKAYRAEYPVSEGPTRTSRPIPAGARQANPEALAFRDAYLRS